MLLKRTFLKDPTDLRDYLSVGSWVLPLWSDLWNPTGPDGCVSISAGRVPVAPEDLALAVTKESVPHWHRSDSNSGCHKAFGNGLHHPHQNLLFWKMPHRVLNECVSPDNEVWHHKTRTNARLSSLVQLTHIKSSAWPANTPRINPEQHFYPSSNLAWYQLIWDI